MYCFHLRILCSLVALSHTVGAAWIKQPKTNCYGDRGGVPKDPKDLPLRGRSLESCHDHCMADPACVGVTRNIGDGLGAGDCWLRVALDVTKCDHGVAYDTYVNGRDPFKWISDLEKHGGHSVLPPGTFYIDRQYVLPQGAHLEGAGEGKTIIQAVKFAKEQRQALCGPFHVNRVGIIVGDDTYVGKFTFTGADDNRPYDNGDLCGGGVIETPGCAFPYCASPHTDTDEKGPNINTGRGDGNGATNVVIEHIEVTRNTAQNMVFMPQTEKGKQVSSNIVVRNVVTDGTWADGVNIHGAHRNILVENCRAANTGDDCFAAWDTSVADEYMTNVTFKNNHASNPHFDGNDRDCFSQFGGRNVNYIDNICENPTNSMFHFWIMFCGSGQPGSPGKDACYPPDSVSYMSGNALQGSSKPKIIRDAGNLPLIKPSMNAPTVV